MSHVVARDVVPARRAARSALHEDMIWIPGGTFRMGSDKHYPEEAPVHRVTVDGFFIDRTPVTDVQFKEFVAATGYVTCAEIAPDPKDDPGALPHMLKAGSLVFTPPKGPVDLRNCMNWWAFTFGATWRRPYGPGSTARGLADHPVVHITYRDARRRARPRLDHRRHKARLARHLSERARYQRSAGAVIRCKNQEV